MRIYTSYFGKIKKLRERNIEPVSISRWKPKFYEGKMMLSVAPTPYMLSESCSREEYIRLYKKILENRGAGNIFQEIKSLSGGKDIALCCYETPEKFCHRHLLADFLNTELNLGVNEFEDEKEVKIEEPTLF